MLVRRGCTFGDLLENERVEGEKNVQEEEAYGRKPEHEQAEVHIFHCPSENGEHAIVEGNETHHKYPNYSLKLVQVQLSEDRVLVLLKLLVFGL